MKRTSHTTIFKAVITLGLQKGYTEGLIKVDDVLTFLQHLQNTLILEKNIYMGANCYESILVLSGQKEPHLNLQFIDYPKFPLPEELFKESVEFVATELMKQFEQNRLVIEFHDEMVMLENSEDVDPRIKKAAPGKK